jgi:hypothetical protein
VLSIVIWRLNIMSYKIGEPNMKQMFPPRLRTSEDIDNERGLPETISEKYLTEIERMVVTESLLSEYFQLRKKAKALKEQRKNLHGPNNEHGCDGDLNGEGPCWRILEDSPDEWCDFCKNRHKITMEYYETLKKARSMWMKLYIRYGKG